MKNIFFALLAFSLTIPAWSQDSVKQRLEKSSRHLEWVDVKNGDRTVKCFVAYPEKKEKAAVVLVIHENRGLTDWVRGVADQLAEAGYIAIAPDLLSGKAPGGGNTSAFANEDAAREAIYQLAQDQVTSDLNLNAVADYAAKIPATNGILAVAGFCWGGGQSFRFATQRTALKAAFVFYGMFPYTKEDLGRIASPVYGFYGSDDERIDATIPDTTKDMKELGKTYDPVIYEGAGHGFMRSGEDPSGTPADRKARDSAWERWKKLLSSL
jgi:carboxymethylenebutenolidase